jgi:hypothetical protein
MIKLVIGGMLRILIGLVGIVLSIPAYIFINGPAYLMQIVLKLDCWSRGQHQFDPYHYLFIAPENNVIRCSGCGITMPEKNIPEFLAKRQELINNIKTVSEHLKIASEQAEVEQELTKLE